MPGAPPAHEPDPSIGAPSPNIELRIEARPRDLGGFAVRRVLPAAQRRLIGPFIFFDHMGPAGFTPGHGVDVRPHPHIELATVTYLFEGELDHRDSLGTLQTIFPGDVNWMVAGKGIAHSERTGPAARAAGLNLHGIQSWVALPLASERTEPRFEHHPKSSLPRRTEDGVLLEVIAGTAYGERSPVGVLSPTLYVHARLECGRRLKVDETHEERAMYVVEGSVSCDGVAFRAGEMAVFRPGASVAFEALEPCRVMLVGGAKLDGERHVYWNFVSSSPDRIEQAKADWQNRKFRRVPGDDVEFIPLPELGRPR